MPQGNDHGLAKVINKYLHQFTTVSAGPLSLVSTELLQRQIDEGISQTICQGCGAHVLKQHTCNYCGRKNI